MSTQTVLFPPPLRGAELSQPIQKWLFTLQNLLPLREADTSGGSYSEALPAAGLNSTTGQSNQNQEISFVKISGDGNSITITGAASGSVVLTSQYSFARFKSDGTNWLRIG